MNLTNHLKQDRLVLQYLIGRIDTWYLQNYLQKTIRSFLNIAKTTTLTTHQVLTT